MSRLARALEMIDTANSGDPNSAATTSGPQPAERVYGERMSRMLAEISPGASEVLQIAARGQHIMRWKVPRGSYPEGRAGYHRWRNALKELHGAWVSEIMLASGYSAEEAARCAGLIRKENLKGDGETQTLEDTACLVFLAHYAGPFAAKHDEGKCVAILAKTWSKMSESGRAAALSLDLEPGVRALVLKATTVGRGVA